MGVVSDHRLPLIVDYGLASSVIVEEIVDEVAVETGDSGLIGKVIVYGWLIVFGAPYVFAYDFGDFAACVLDGYRYAVGRILDRRKPSARPDEPGDGSLVALGLDSEVDGADVLTAVGDLGHGNAGAPGIVGNDLGNLPGAVGEVDMLPFAILDFGKAIAIVRKGKLATIGERIARDYVRAAGRAPHGYFITSLIHDD